MGRGWPRARAPA